jgi:hypothetical protein
MVTDFSVVTICQRPKKKLDGRDREGHARKNLNEGQWEDGKQWSLGVGQRRKTF